MALLMIAAFPLTCPAVAHRYYVDPIHGNDSNPGTEAAPLLTVSRALDGSVALPGDTVYLRGGVYRPMVGSGWETHHYAVVLHGAPGLPGKPITVSAYPGERPILKGSIVATNWHLVTDPEFTNLGFPPEGAGHIYALTNWMCDTNNKLMLSYGRWSYKSNPQQVFVSNSETNDGAALQQISWPTSFATTCPDGIIPFPKDGGSPPPGNNLWYEGIDGHPSDMVAGSFYYLEVTNTTADTSTIYVWLPDGGDPRTKVMEVSVATSIFSGGAYTVLKNLAFRHSNRLAWGVAGGAVGVGSGGIIDNCDIQWCDCTAVCSDKNTIIRRSTIAHVGMTGMLLLSGSKVDSCYFSDCNYRNFNLGWQSGAIKCGSKNVLVQNCEFTRINGACIWFDHADDTNGPPSIVRRNYLHDNVARWRREWTDEAHTNTYLTRQRVGIELEASRNVNIYNNLIISNATYSIVLWGSQQCKVFKNLIVYEDSREGPGLHNEATSLAMHNAWGRMAERNRILRNVFYNNIYGVTHSVQTNEGLDPTLWNKCDSNRYYNSMTNFPVRFYSIYDPLSFTAWRTFSGYDLHSRLQNPGLARPSAVASAMRHFQLTANRRGYNPNRR